jgi:hypothetical protein
MRECLLPEASRTRLLWILTRFASVQEELTVYVQLQFDKVHNQIKGIRKIMTLAEKAKRNFTSACHPFTCTYHRFKTRWPEVPSTSSELKGNIQFCCKVRCDPVR